MSDATLLLGPILFRNFEIPGRLRWGGAQRLAVHRLAGGTRVIDALGRDDADIVWSGTFTGADATQRARAVDLMRAGGAVWPLSWNWYFYSVVIADFQADYQRENWIPYRISCKVLRDEAEGTTAIAVSLASSLSSDLSTADGFGSGVGLNGAITSAAVTDATIPGSLAYSQSNAAIAAASGQLDSQMTTTEAQMAGVTPDSVAGLGATVNLAGQLASLVSARAYVRRAQVNLANAEG